MDVVKLVVRVNYVGWYGGKEIVVIYYIMVFSIK